MSEHNFGNYDGKTPLGKNKVDCWSDKNDEAGLQDVPKDSDKPYWFDCDKCPHDFDISLNDIACGKWCPYCANQRLCNYFFCDDCYIRSFAHYKGETPLGKRKIYCWSDKRIRHNPRNILKVSDEKHWFVCDVCPCHFYNTISNISKGSWCPYCPVPDKKSSIMQNL